MELIHAEANRLRAELARLNETGTVWLSGIVKEENATSHIMGKCSSILSMFSVCARHQHAG